MSSLSLLSVALKSYAIRSVCLSYVCNTVFEFSSAFVSGKQWHREYRGQLPRHLCCKTMREIACSVARWWIQSLRFCFWNRRIKHVAGWTVKKKLSWISRFHLFRANFILVRLIVALVIIKVINLSQNELKMVIIFFFCTWRGFLEDYLPKV